MKVAVIGASGMLGHKLFQVFRENGFDTYGIIRQPTEKFRKFKIFDRKKIIGNIDATDLQKLSGAIGKIRPDVVINAVGVVKQVCNDPAPAIRLNSLLPHQLAKVCTENSARLIQVSTDCVFSGKKGNYSELDFPDADDLYGRTKLLGEVAYGGHLTIRTSIIGRELFTSHGLIEWFLSQKGEIKGYSNAIFSGLSTQELARVLIQLAHKPEISGLLNIGTEKIDKYSLLMKAKKYFGRGTIKISKYPDFKCDRSLDISRMKKLGLKAKGYDAMLAEMAEDSLYPK